MKNGDKMTMEGVYKHRTFWEWVTRKPRVLAQFTISGITPCEPQIMPSESHIEYIRELKKKADEEVSRILLESYMTI